jgi:hypothetical protein
MTGSYDWLVAPRCKGFAKAFNNKPMSLSFQSPTRQRRMSASGLGAVIPESKRERRKWLDSSRSSDRQ